MTEQIDTAGQIRVTPIPHLAKGDRWRVEAMRSYSSDLLLWFSRGQGRITVAGKTSGYNSQNVVFIPAGVMHGFEVSAHVFGNAVFIPKNLKLSLPKSPVHLRVNDVSAQSEISGMLENLLRELASDSPQSMDAAHHYTGLLGIWIKRQMLLHNDNAKTPDAAQMLTKRFTELVENEYRSGMNIAQYAAALGVTPTHLSRGCNQTCGRPASELLSDRVIFEARRLLRETKTPINQVASELGFRSPGYFTRTFQHHTGQTPSAFRKTE